jgi:hypothetical protein
VKEAHAMALQVLAALALGLMCGSELNVAVFLLLETHVLLRASFARLFGRVMPFWMAGSTMLNLLLLLLFAHVQHPAWRLATIAFAIQALAIPFSLVGPVPINNRVIRWTPQSLPRDWKEQEHRWDVYHWVRRGALIVVFALLILGVMLR